ncbi:alanine racemase [Catenuloplanes atrovinosus]|uniref:Alanine racemase n=1 Tax=Catenuloplanes atrovinosus TaxID=137266 RepID=A0AAE4CDT9_9ACTN|nr:alanine racemase [Catenuloplanes atrovinosus]MDR7279404.1 alanine racemase [Catenuloplanes atrovinosus]
MWQAEVRVDLDAIRANVAHLVAGTTAEVMAVVKSDGYGHGMVASARAALDGGATWLGVASPAEAITLRESGLTTPILAWLVGPGLPLHEAVAADVDLSVATLGLLDEVIAAGEHTGRVARVHLKIDTGMTRGGATLADWPVLLEAAAKAQSDDLIDVVGVWSHLACADAPGDASVDAQLAVFHEALEMADRFGIRPRFRHLANSAAALTRPDTHFDLIRPGLAIYGLSPMGGRVEGLRPAMTARARVMLAKRVPAGSGVSYGHTYVTPAETTIAVVPIGYADGIPRHGSNAAPVLIGGRVRPIAGRVCMDQFAVDCGDDPVHDGDLVTLFGPGDDGEPTADDWAEAAGTINYEIVARFGSPRVARVFDGLRPEVGA